MLQDPSSTTTTAQCPPSPPSQHDCKLVRETGLHPEHIIPFNHCNQTSKAVKESASLSCAATLDIPDQGQVMYTNLLAGGCGAEVVLLPLSIGSDSIGPSTQSVIPMTGAQCIDDGHIQGQSTKANRAGAVR